MGRTGKASSNRRSVVYLTGLSLSESLYLVNAVSCAPDLSYFPEPITSPGVSTSGIVARILQIDAPVSVWKWQASTIPANPVAIDAIADAVVDLNPVQRLVAHHVALDGISHRRNSRRTERIDIEDDSRRLAAKRLRLRFIQADRIIPNPVAVA